jgi:predicted outer membrane repeat protein
MFAAACRVVAFVLRVSVKNESRKNQSRNDSRSAIREIQSLTALPAALIAALLGLMAIEPALAQNTFSVTRFDDTAANVTYTNPSDGLGTGVSGDLRFEMLAAMTAGGTNTITFSGCSTASPCTITLNGPLPPIFEINNPSSFSLTIDGGEEGAVILDGNSQNGGTNRVFFVDNVAVTLKNLVIQNAKAQGGNGGNANSSSGGGGAGFGACLFVNQSTAAATVQNTSFSGCAAIGGQGGLSVGSSQAGGGGLGFSGASGAAISGGVGGGGGVSGPANHDNGGTGGGGAGDGGQPGAGYGANPAGVGPNGGFGGGGGGGHAGDAGNGGFGGGGGGVLFDAPGNGGFGGGGGYTGGSAPAVGGVQGGAGSGNIGGAGGGAAAGPAIFVNAGSVVLQNATGTGFQATPGPGGNDASAGTADTSPIFNYAGTVNGSTTVGGLPGALPVGGNSSGTVYGGTPVGQASAVQTATLWITTAGQPAKLNVLTQGAANLDFQLASGSTCSTSTTYTVGQSCTVNFTFAPLHPGLRMSGITLTDGSGNVLASVLVSGLATGPQAVFNATGTAVTALGGGFTVPYATAVDASGNVYVADPHNIAVYEIPLGCSNSSCLISLGGGFNGPLGVALDGAGNVYVADSPDLKVMPPGCGSPSCVTSLVALTGAATIAVDGAGNLFSDRQGGAVELPVGCSNDGCVISLTGGYDSLTSGTPVQATVDASGNVYYATESSTIVVLPAGCRSSSCVTTMGGGFGSVTGVAVDASGNVYASDSKNGTVSVVPPGCTSSSCVTLLQSGLTRAGAIALDGNGNLYVSQRVAGTGLSTVKQFALATAPTVNFATSTTDGITDTTDGTQTVQVFNNGNQPLIFTGLTYGADFPEAGGDSSSCYSSISLAASAECDLPIAFEPVAPSSGALSESVTLTDNTLNASSATQSITVTGTAIAPVIVPTLTPYFANSPVSMPLGGNISFFVLVANPSSTAAISNGTVTISLPAGLQVVLGSLGTTCPGTVTYSPSSSTITHTGIALGKSANCQDGFTLTATGLGPQSVSATATVGASSGSSVSASISVADVAARLLLDGQPSFVFAGFQFTFVVAAVDPQGNLDTSYAGTITFTSSDQAAGLPSSYTFNPATDAGAHEFPATLNTVGQQTITATDSVDNLSVTPGNITVSIPNFVVTTAADDAGTASNCTVQANAGTGTDGACSLRDALLLAGELGSANISFDGTVFSASNTTAQNTITLTNDVLNLPNNVTIAGPFTGSGATLNNRVTISGNNQYEVFSINSATATLTGLAIVNGNHGGYGGGINDNGTLTLNDCTVANNQASNYGNGGGIFNGGMLTVANSNFTSNYGGLYGGAIQNNGTAVIATSNFVKNSSWDGGGAIYTTGPLTLTNSTISGNTAPSGGGIYGSSGNATITNTTISGNQANYGGGIDVDQANVTVNSSTISGNSAGFSGGGVWIGTVVSLSNSIVSGNQGGDLFTPYNNIGAGYVDHGGNQVGSGSINLAPLGGYGGATQTALPLPGSSAICAGTKANATAANLTTDQRGLPFDPNCPSGSVDSGAAQSNYAISFSTDASNVLANTAMNPAPAVTLKESGSPFLNNPVAIPLTLNGNGTLTSGSVSTSSSTGIATYSGLSVSAAGTGDSLTANLVLDSPVALSVTSSKFNVTVAQVAVPNVVGVPQAGATVVLTGAELTLGNVTSAYSSTVAAGDVISTNPAAGTNVNIGSAVNLVISLGVAPVATTVQITGAPSSDYLGGAFNFTVTVYDQFNNVATGYTGTMAFTSTDTAASLPGNYTFTAADAGSHLFTATLNTVGSQTITATDSANSLTVTTGSIAVSIPNLVVTTSADDAGTASNCTKQSTPGTGTDSSCSLRDALAEAGTLGSANITFDGTVFATAQTITLGTVGTMNIPSHTTITGSGATPTQRVTVSGDKQYGVFNVGSGESGVSINGLAITDGYSSEGGGAIAASSPLVVRNSTFSGNYGNGGGGAISANSTLTVNNSTFFGNSAFDGPGGAIFATGTLMVSNSTFSGNSAIDGNGGAIDAQSSSTTISNSIFANDSAGSPGINATNGAIADHNLFYGGDACNGCTTNTNSVSGNPNLAVLGNYGGATQTMLPLPGSAAICAGVAESINSTPITADQRVVSIPTTYGTTQCYDIGAVQTNYAMSSTLAVPSVVTLGSEVSPAPTVTISESGTPLTAGTATVTMIDADNDLSSSGTNTATNSISNVNPGQVSFSNLEFTAAEASDKLTATLPLNPALVPALNLTATSGTFQVGQLSTLLSFTPSPASQTYGTAIAAGTLDATATANGAPIQGSFTYKTTVNSASTALVAGSTILPAGTYTITAAFTPSNTSVDASASTTAPYTVKQATPTVSVWPTASPITYGQALSASTLTGGTASVAGEFAWTTPTIIPGAGVQTESVTFTPSNAIDYTTPALANITLTVNKATPTVSVWPTASAINSGQSLSASTLTGGAASLTGAFAWTTPTLVPGAGSQTESVTFTPSNTADYLSVTGTVSINVTASKGNLVITASSPTMSYGSRAPVITASYSGFLPGDSAASLTVLPTCATTATSISNVGSYTTSCSGAVDTKYIITYKTGSLSVTPAVLTVAATSQSDVYGLVDFDGCGNANKHLAYTITGFVNGQTQSQVVTGAPAESTTATPASKVGIYPINITQGTLALTSSYGKNYSLTYVNGTLTVTPATLYVVANSYTRKTGSVNPSFGYTFLGFVNQDNRSNALTGAPSCCTTTATKSSPVGLYPIVISLGTLAAKNVDYTFKFVNGVLVVY